MFHSSLETPFSKIISLFALLSFHTRLLQFSFLFLHFTFLSSSKIRSSLFYPSLIVFIESIFITDSLLGCLWRCWWYKDCWAKTACEPCQAKTQGTTGEICTWWLQRLVSYTILLVLIFVESGDRDDHRGYSRHSSRYWETNKAIMLAILCNILNDCRAFWAFWVTNYIL